MSDKLTQYNQKLLAIIGTTIAIGLGLMIVITGSVFVYDIIRDMSKPDNDNALTVNIEQDSDETAQQVRKQEISFSKPRLIDTVRSIYLIPVSQVNLENPEEITNEEPNRSNYFGKRKYPKYNYSGSYNNIVLLHHKTDTKSKVFDTKVNINSFENYIIDDKQYLFISGTTHDSNKDGKLKYSDLQSFFIYSIEDNKLETIEFEKMGLVDFYIIYDTDEIVLRFGSDKNQDGELDRNIEPFYLKKHIVSENKTTDLIDKELIDDLQKLIE